MDVLISGEAYENLPATYVIFICDFDPFGESKYCYTFANQCIENFSKKIREATNGLKVLPKGHNTTDFEYRGYTIYLKPYRTYLIFYIVDEEKSIVTILRVLRDGMYWQYILRRWLKES